MMITKKCIPYDIQELEIVDHPETDMDNYYILYKDKGQKTCNKINISFKSCLPQ